MRTRNLRRVWLRGFPSSAAWRVLVLELLSIIALVVLVYQVQAAADAMEFLLLRAPGVFRAFALCLLLLIALSLARLVDRRSPWRW